jgi:hypothetical protein
MAQRCAEGLRELYLYCYFQPTLHVHATVSALTERMVSTQNGGVTFDEGRQREKADQTLFFAHHVILYALSTQNSYFELNLDKEIDQRFAEFRSVWNDKGK